MKKVLALVLAVMMLATVAFAIDNPTTETISYPAGDWFPGSTIAINDSGIVAKGNHASNSADPNYGKYALWADAAEGQVGVKAINSTNYSITGLKYEDGKALVASVKFNDADDKVEIKLNKDYTNTKKKPLELTFTLKGKKVGKSAKPASIDVKIKGTVGYELETEDLYMDANDKVILPADGPDGKDGFAEGKLYKVKDSGKVNYGTLEFTAVDGDTDVEVRVYKDDKLYLFNNVNANSDILKKYADEDADITFLNFPGAPSFNATATVRFYKEEGTYIYELKDDVLTAITAEAASAGAAGQTAGKVKWDEDEGCYILKTRTLGNYVFSDVALPLDVANNTTDTPVTNPDTGANDVVGIATALAAVALVSAAAVSLKK